MIAIEKMQFYFEVLNFIFSMSQYVEIEEGKVIVQSCGHMQIKFWLQFFFFFTLAVWDVQSFYFSFQWIFILMTITK